MVKVKLAEKLDSLNSLINEVKGASSNVGAIIVFIGTVRGVGKNGGNVLRLEYEAYKEVAERALEEIISELKDKHGVIDAILEHKLGQAGVGEDTVYAIVASRHREEGFKFLTELIDRLKSEVPIWKKEITDRGSQWIEG